MPSATQPSSETARYLASSESAAAHPHLAATRYWEQWRGAATGWTRAGVRSVVLLVAVKVYDASGNATALLASAFFIGLLLTPLVSHTVARWRCPVARANAGLFGAAALGLLLAAWSGTFPLFFAGILIGVPLLASTTPLVTALWRQNAPDHLRGQLFSRVSFLGMLGTLLGAAAFAAWLRDDPGRYRAIMATLALALAGASLASFQIPSQPLKKAGKNPLANLAFLWRDPLFGYISFAWMLMGFSVLTIIPLRVVFLAAKAPGLAYPAWLVLVLVDVIPETTRLLSVRFWGRRFDRMNFIAMRIALNVCFALGIVLFFTPRLWSQVLGSLFFGLGAGGGEIAWSLWVTKFAPAERTAEYMSVHTFLTGTRGIAGPLLGFNLIALLGIVPIARSCAGLIGISCLFLLFVLPLGRRGPPSESNP